ncbi:hypothetical protein LOD99_15337 [Oopsacas minuta]|uniref:Uncharacterized protein n=1 Tax=Oopsacas minuta TaxID=111878 RepID=A0AAV7KAM9_9METZ|nr:hypothetical protein LOD99_15337 [Oopsacas minuta]
MDSQITQTTDTEFAETPSLLETPTCFVAENPTFEIIKTQEKDLEYVATQKFKINEESSKYLEDFFPRKRSLLAPKWEKFILCLFSFSLIAFIIVFSASAIILELIVDIFTTTAELNSFNVTLELVESLTNLTNSSIDYEIKCPVNYIHSENSMFCSPACNHPDLIFSDTALLIDTIIILFIDISGAILGIFTLITWPFVKSFWKFPQITILFLVICLTLLTCIFVVIDLPGVFCGFDVTQSFDDQFVEFQPNLMAAGALIHYLRIAVMFWTLFTLLNIYLSTLGPSTFDPQGRVKNVLVIIEIVISFGVPLLFVITVLASQVKLFWDAFGSFPDYTHTAAYVIGRIIPDYFTATFSLIFIILILTRLRFMSIDSKHLLGKGRKLSPLEIRLIIYCIISSLVFYFFIVESAQFFTLYEEEFSQIYNSRACVTLSSPLIEKRGNISFYHNATSDLIPAATWKNGTICDEIKPYIDKYPPIWLSVYNICYRLIINSFFLIFILKTNLLIWVGWGKWIWNKCLCCFCKKGK